MWDILGSPGNSFTVASNLNHGFVLSPLLFSSIKNDKPVGHNLTSWIKQEELVEVNYTLKTPLDDIEPQSLERNPSLQDEEF